MLDLETTGTGQLCRIVEMALLLLSAEGELQQEWTTLINPGIPIPNAAVRGIDEALASSAPVFADMAPELACLLDSHDWLPTTVTIPSAGGTIAFLGEDARGWDFKVQKALEHATSPGAHPDAS